MEHEEHEEHEGKGMEQGGPPEGERSDRDIGGPTSAEGASEEEDVTGGGQSQRPEGGFEAHE